MQTNIVIGIPAYNEQYNIGQLLYDILSQKNTIESKNIKLAKILVISDSSDDTDNIVLDISKTNYLIKLIKRNGRLGKSSAINIIFDEAKDCDIVILLDADIRLEKRSLKYLIDGLLKYDDAGIAGGNPVPIVPISLNVAERISFFSWALLDAIKSNSKESLYHSHGRILALKKIFYNREIIPEVIKAGDDQYLYLSCIKKGLRFVYVPDAKVTFKLPREINDHLRQSVRFSESLKFNESIFGKKLINDNMKIWNKKILFRSFIRYPYKGSFWMIIYVFGRLLYKIQKSEFKWEISKTTKE